jgi:hypothetical protein
MHRLFAYIINKQSGLRSCKYEQKWSPDCGPAKKLLFLLFEVVGAVFFLEAFDPAGGIDVLLFAGVKWVANRADFGVDFAHGAAGFKGVAAAAVNHYFVIFWMYIFLHKQFPKYYKPFILPNRIYNSKSNIYMAENEILTCLSL